MASLSQDVLFTGKEIHLSQGWGPKALEANGFDFDQLTDFDVFRLNGNGQNLILMSAGSARETAQS